MEEQKLSRSQSKKLREEIVEIRSLAKQHDMSDMADEFIANGNSLEQFRSALLDAISNDEPLETPEVPAFVRNIKHLQFWKIIFLAHRIIFWPGIIIIIIFIFNDS